jgi:hypothetical protein
MRPFCNALLIAALALAAWPAAAAEPTREELLLRIELLEAKLKLYELERAAPVEAPPKSAARPAVMPKKAVVPAGASKWPKLPPVSRDEGDYADEPSVPAPKAAADAGVMPSQEALEAVAYDRWDALGCYTNAPADVYVAASLKAYREGRWSAEDVEDAKRRTAAKRSPAPQAAEPEPAAKAKEHFPGAGYTSAEYFERNKGMTPEAYARWKFAMPHHPADPHLTEAELVAVIRRDGHDPYPPLSWQKGATTPDGVREALAIYGHTQADVARMGSDEVAKATMDRHSAWLRAGAPTGTFEYRIWQQQLANLAEAGRNGRSVQCGPDD